MNSETFGNTDPSQEPEAKTFWGASLAFLGAALTGGQTAYVLFTGDEFCVGQGCALVGQLTRISPAAFNLIGCGIFLAIALLAMASRGKQATASRFALRLLLTAAFAAEGVLFPYQYFVASAWCTYCLVILTLIVALNGVLAGRNAVYGLVSFAAAATIFSLLSFTPFNKTLDHGTYAVQTGNGGPELYLLFSEDCPHCNEVEKQLSNLSGCSVSYNPVKKVTTPLFDEYEKASTYDPRVNLAAASLLGLRQIPILVVKEETGLQIVTGTQFIIDYVQSMCSGSPQGPDLFDDSWQQDRLFPPEDDGCGLNVDCN